MAPISEWMEQCGKKVKKVLDNAGMSETPVYQITKERAERVGFEPLTNRKQRA
jgi:hypothetical protein